jgi:alkanesulfonate monooxygenase SsuD/methylene tetrahydromethanopterin reductase-like flavin-dependent oxidoreductase (luciferase family)
MRIGTVVPMADGDAHEGTAEWDEIRRFAQHAEGVGVDSLWVFDHMYSNVPGTEPRGVHEAWSLLAALAVATEKVELGQLVMCASFRPPAMLAKMAITTDQISGGRLTLGLGAGWHDQEYRAFGFPLDHRVSRFEEALQIIVPLLKGETVSFKGERVDPGRNIVRRRSRAHEHLTVPQREGLERRPVRDRRHFGLADLAWSGAATPTWRAAAFEDQLIS